MQCFAIQRREYPKKMFPKLNKTMWLIAFAGELGDVVSRPLPHGILDNTQAGGFPQKSGLVCVCLNFSLFLKVCRGSLGGPVSPGAYQLNPPKMYINMKGNYFLNSRHYLFLKSWKLFL